MEKETLQSAEYFEWQPASSVPAVLLRRTAMAGIKRNVVEGLKSLPRRGAEVGGALLGRRNAETGEFIVEGFEPIPSEYETGPSYILSERDIGLWRERIAELRKASPGFIGIYRSQTRPGLMIMPEDCAMVERFLPREEGVLLLVKPLSVSESLGAFFHCDGGAVLDEAVSTRQFSFDEAVSPSKQAILARRIGKMSVWIPLSAAMAGIAMGLVFHYGRNRAGENPVAPPVTAPVAATSGLHLRVEPNGSNLRVEWDPASSLLDGATGAILNVADGNTRKALRLTAADLRNGYVEWNPSSPGVTFEMLVERPGQASVAESAHSSQPPGPGYTINSLSDSAIRKPAASAASSPQTGDRNGQVSSPPRPPAESPLPLAGKSQQGGRVKRIVNGITSKVSHLWPFHSAKPARKTP
jgi:hypothetical protein